MDGRAASSKGGHSTRYANHQEARSTAETLGSNRSDSKDDQNIMPVSRAS